MGVFSEINSLVKKAQAPGFVPTPLYYSSMMPKDMRERVQKDWAPGGELDSWHNLAQSKMLRGVARGAKNAIPGFIDGVIGTGAGLINGTGQWLGGGSFSDGWKESNDFVKKYYSDPIRKAEMAIGGNAVKKVFDGADSYYRGNIEKAIGQTHDANGVPTKKYKDYVEGLNMLDSASDMASFGTELAITWPMWSKAIGYGTKALGAAGSRVAPLIKADPARLGAAAQKYGPLAVLAGQEAPVVKSVAENGVKVMKQAPVDESQKKMRESIDWLKATAQSHPEMITDDMMGTLNGYYNNGQMSEADFSSIRSSVRRHRAKEFLSQFSPEQQSEILARLNGGSR